jgi:uncharacterized protein
MRTKLVLAAFLFLEAFPSCRSKVPETPAENASRSVIRPVPFESVRLTDAFWRPRLRTNRTVTIPHIMKENEETGRVDNFRKAAGTIPGSYQGRRFNDTDTYKVIEAASYALAQEYDRTLDAQVDELIALIAAAQSGDGYLYPARTIDPANPAPGVGPERWIHESAGSHELYDAGHLIEAAVAHYRATGKKSLLKVAIRFADLIDRDFGPDARHDVPGHEEIELALVKLADVTGERRYLDLARFFLDQRGREHDGKPYPEGNFAIYNDRAYKQDHEPVVDQRKASGHAVRATYLYIGMSDVAARTGAPGYEMALESIWKDVVSTKLYLTGGIGSRGTFESFGEDYELPNRTAYTESCASVGNDLWNHRMFLSTGDPRFLDVMERVLYNGALSGVSAAGDRFFYTNPLESEGGVERSPYFDVACCPANLARLIALLPGMIYAERDDELFVNLFVASEAEVTLGSGGRMRVTQETRYPWDGRVRIALTPDEPVVASIHVRIPGWARGEPVPSDLYRFSEGVQDRPTLTVDGEPVALGGEEGFATVRREWKSGDALDLVLPMPVRRVRANAAVAEDEGKTALQRGPLVYAAEGVDNAGRVLDLVLPAEGPLQSEWDDGLLGGVIRVAGKAIRGDREVPFSAIPYFDWANRGPGEMVVWFPTRDAGSVPPSP